MDMLPILPPQMGVISMGHNFSIFLVQDSHPWEKSHQDFALARELCAKRVAKIYPELHRLALELLR